MLAGARTVSSGFNGNVGFTAPPGARLQGALALVVTCGLGQITAHAEFT
jgi:hypothetical protein